VLELPLASSVDVLDEFDTQTFDDGKKDSAAIPIVENFDPANAAISLREGEPNELPIRVPSPGAPGYAAVVFRGPIAPEGVREAAVS
jgi:hypothetical protein